MLSFEQWIAGGQRVRLSIMQDGRLESYEIFYRTEGTGDWLTFLHGFPTHSWDWHKINEALKPHYRLLFFDFLGFGDSDKPRDHQYNLLEQANLTQALWQHLGVTTTGLIAHDYGVSVGQELLHRHNHNLMDTKLTDLTFLNGGLFSDLHRPLRVQKLLRRPVLGALISLVMTERTFAKNFAKVFSPRYMLSAAELHECWEGIVRRGGKNMYHKLIHYIADRKIYKERWEAALTEAKIPLRFIWGLVDPVSGAHVAQHLKQTLPNLNILELSEVGHYPQLEVPEVVAKRILELRANLA
jgi:pimeloyl-ACP methyl ester carboxylesterase